MKLVSFINSSTSTSRSWRPFLEADLERIVEDDDDVDGLWDLLTDGVRLPDTLCLPDGVCLPDKLCLPDGVCLPDRLCLPAGVCLPDGLPVGVADRVRDIVLSPADCSNDSRTGLTFLCSAGIRVDATLFRDEMLQTPLVTHARSSDSAPALDSDLEEVRQPMSVFPNCARVERPFEVEIDCGVGNIEAFSSIISNMSGSPAA